MEKIFNPSADVLLVQIPFLIFSYSELLQITAHKGEKTNKITSTMKKSRRDFIQKSALGATGFALAAHSLKVSGKENMVGAHPEHADAEDSTNRDAGDSPNRDAGDSPNHDAGDSPNRDAGTSLRERREMVKPVTGGGPASRYEPRIMAAMVRRREDYGMWWPGAVYDGKAAMDRYTAQLKQTARTLGMQLELRPEPIYSHEEADAWVAKVKNSSPDGIVLLVMDRQQHSWPTAYKVADIGIPTIVFAPLGCAFHQNTSPLAEKPGCVVYSTTLEDSGQLLFGMKMLEAGAKIRHSRCINFRGDQHGESIMEDLGITVQHLPVQTYIDEVNQVPTSADVLAMAEDLMRRAHQRLGPTREDVINGVKGYFAARRILEREKGDSITLAGCVDLEKYRPCIGWVTLSDEGIPSACEGDLEAVASKTIVQYLFNRPGFQQDPVPDTANRAFIGAHCQCATRLNGFDQPPEPFSITHHHGNTDATIVPRWREGQKVTAIDVIQQKGEQSQIHLFTGTVMDNISVPPNGGCVVSVRFKIDGIESSRDVLTTPGFHQVFFYGDYGREIEDFCKLYDLKLLKYG